MLNLDMTLGEFLAGIMETNAKFAKFVGQEENGDARYAVIVTFGKETTDEVLKLVDSLSTAGA